MSYQKIINKTNMKLKQSNLCDLLQTFETTQQLCVRNRLKVTIYLRIWRYQLDPTHMIRTSSSVSWLLFISCSLPSLVSPNCMGLNWRAKDTVMLSLLHHMICSPLVAPSTDYTWCSPEPKKPDSSIILEGKKCLQNVF